MSWPRSQEPGPTLRPNGAEPIGAARAAPNETAHQARARWANPQRVRLLELGPQGHGHHIATQIAFRSCMRASCVHACMHACTHEARMHDLNAIWVAIWWPCPCGPSSNSLTLWGLAHRARA